MLACTGPRWVVNAGRRRVVDLGADDVAGQQVGRALDPAERPAHGVGQRRRGGRLGQAGDAFEEDVAAGQQADEQRLLQPALTDDLAAERLRQPLQRVARPRHLVGAQDGSGGLFHRVIVNNVGMRRRRSAYRPAPAGHPVCLYAWPTTRCCCARPSSTRPMPEAWPSSIGSCSDWHTVRATNRPRPARTTRTGGSGWSCATPAGTSSRSSRSSELTPSTWPEPGVPQQLHLDLTVATREALAAGARPGTRARGAAAP